MIRSCRPAALALLLLFAVHLRPVYRVSVEGERMPGLYAGAQIREAREAAREAAEELLPGEAALPAPRTSLRICLGRPNGETAALSDALLCAAEDVTRAAFIQVNGVALGTVADGEALLEELRAAIRGGMPAGAAVGSLSGQLQVRPVYTRVGLERSCDAVLADILAAAPAFYLDSDGKLV